MAADSFLHHSPESDLVFYLQDIRRFTNVAEETPRAFTYLVFATFGAIQAGMIITRGSDWLETPHDQLPAGKKPRAKHYEKLFKELKSPSNWSGFEGYALASDTNWDRGVLAIKAMRDDLEHPKYDSLNLGSASIRHECLDGLDYLRYLVQESPRIRERFGKHWHELLDLLSAAISALCDIKIDQVTPITVVPWADLSDATTASLQSHAQAQGAKLQVVEHGLPSDLPIHPSPLDR